MNQKPIAQRSQGDLNKGVVLLARVFNLR